MQPAGALGQGDAAAAAALRWADGPVVDGDTGKMVMDRGPGETGFADVAAAAEEHSLWHRAD